VVWSAVERPSIIGFFECGTASLGDHTSQKQNRARKEASIEFDACWDASLRARLGEKAASFRETSVAIKV